MHSLSEIEAAIKQLPEVEVRQLFDWLEVYLEDAWNEQIKADLTTPYASTSLRSVKGRGFLSSNILTT